MTVRLVRIWTHKNADEKAHTLSRRSKRVKKRTKTYEKRILCKLTFNEVCTANFMPRFKSIILHQISLKLSYFCKKMQKFQALGVQPQTPNSRRRLRPTPPKHSPTHCKFLATCLITSSLNKQML